MENVCAQPYQAIQPCDFTRLDTPNDFSLLRSIADSQPTANSRNDEQRFKALSPSEAPDSIRADRAWRKSRFRESGFDNVKLKSQLITGNQKRGYSEIREADLEYRSPILADEVDFKPPKLFAGWRVGILWSAFIFGFCLLGEIAMLLIATHMQHAGDNVLFVGNCNRTRYLVAMSALPLNAIATLLTTASNYVMQCVSSPSRSELDKAHCSGKSMNIGVFSPTNISHLRISKSVAWILMGLTSIPVHLLFNSTFYTPMQANDYGVLIVNDDFEDESNWSSCSPGAPAMISNHESICTIHEQQTTKQSSTYRMMDQEDCVLAYAAELNSQYSNVIAVATSDWSTSSNPEVRETFPAVLGYFSIRDYAGGTFDQPQWNERSYNDWLCTIDYPWGCDAASVLLNVSDPQLGWVVTPENITIDHCYAQQTTQGQCKIEYSPTIILIVIACDATKLLISLYALVRIKDSPCVTIGDAIASYLQSPDSITKGRCLATNTQVQDDELCCAMFFKPNLSGNTFGPRTQKWYSELGHFQLIRSTSIGRWIVFATVSGLLFFGCGWIFEICMQQVILYHDTEWWRRGLTNADIDTLFVVRQGDMSATTLYLDTVITVNMPQLVMTLFYYAYNGILTSMQVAKEWSSYGTERQPLRVSSPSHGQRSTYWLSLPWKFSIPLILVSACLHWLASRSAYMTQFDFVDIEGIHNPGQKTPAAGYNPLAILIVLIVYALLFLLLLGLSAMQVKAAIPLVGTNSVAISASCHSDLIDPSNEPYKPLRWGVVREETKEGTPGHCTFTSEAVTRPVEGHLYA